LKRFRFLKQNKKEEKEKPKETIGKKQKNILN
jgi:hypothetical protein